MSDNINDDTLDKPIISQPENLSDEIISANDTDSIIQKQETENMEVHHHPDIHHKKKNFKEYFLEFLMIFLAVTMGFFAESYREYSVEKARAKEYANSLIHDLEKDTAMVQIDISQMKHARSKIDSLASFLKDKKIGEISNRQFFGYTLFPTLYRPFTWSRATLDEIKSSGSLRYFDNDSIIMRVSAYDALTKHMDQDFNGDVALTERVSEKRNRIIDMNYSLPDSVNYSLIDADSIITILLKNKTNYNGHDDLQLLTSNINDIRSLLNDYLDIRQSLYIRGDRELTHLLSDATQLITMLQKEYSIKDEQ
ncbi:hypothetical protein EFY79_14085 [Hanamia caeni]|uniref:Uncharacterized protein n=1 Tax=Hanamia caeni TaxID=2294116 RepID=A0A3M9NC23_9BACT|nr:hypothetical protein [Hanamia caeni]RNI34813.1 hypothetical protein EFY79_14085 [Hanamia caeni]